MTLPTKTTVTAYVCGCLTVLTAVLIVQSFHHAGPAYWLASVFVGAGTLGLYLRMFSYRDELEQVRIQRDEALETVQHLSWVSALFMRHLVQVDELLNKWERSPTSTVELTRIELMLRETRFWQWVSQTLDPGFDDGAMTSHEAARFLSGFTHRFEEGLQMHSFTVVSRDLRGLYQACERAAGDSFSLAQLLFRAKPPSQTMRTARYTLSEQAWNLSRHLPAQVVGPMIKDVSAKALAWLARQEGTPESPHAPILMQHVAQGATVREDGQVSA